MAGTTLQSLVERVANRYQVMDSFTTATTNGGTTTTAVSTGFWLPDGGYEGRWAYISATNGSAAPYNEERQAKQSSQTSTSITFTHAMTAAVPNLATVQLYTRWTHAQIVNAVNDATRHSGGYWWQSVVNEAKTTVAGDYSISLAGLAIPLEERFGLRSVAWQVNTTESTYPYEPIHDWTLRWDGTTPTLQFSKTYTASRTLRLEYIASPSVMTSPTNATGVDVSTWFDDFVVEYALHELFQQRSSFAPKGDKRGDKELAQMHRDEAERLRRMHAMRYPTKKFRSRLADKPGDDRKYAGAFSP
jgi:hypothetical protein